MEEIRAMCDETFFSEHEYNQVWASSTFSKDSENPCLKNGMINFDDSINTYPFTVDTNLTGSNQCKEDILFWGNSNASNYEYRISELLGTMDSNNNNNNFDNSHQCDTHKHELLENNFCNEHEENSNINFLTDFNNKICDFNNKFSTGYETSNCDLRDGIGEFNDSLRKIGTLDLPSSNLSYINFGGMLFNERKSNTQLPNEWTVNNIKNCSNDLFQNLEFETNNYSTLIDQNAELVEDMFECKTNANFFAENHGEDNSMSTCLEQNGRKSVSQLNKCKKERFARFTQTELEHLNRAFDQSPYLTPEVLMSLVHTLGLSETRIKIWFKNKRQKGRRNSGQNLKKGKRKSAMENDWFDGKKQTLVNHLPQLFQQSHCN